MKLTIIFDLDQLDLKPCPAGRMTFIYPASPSATPRRTDKRRELYQILGKSQEELATKALRHGETQ
jgi:hypothetical protein